MKYKRGDKVRIIGCRWVPDFTEGTIVWISTITSDPVCTIRALGRLIWTTRYNI